MYMICVLATNATFKETRQKKLQYFISFNNLSLKEFNADALFEKLL